MEEMLVKEVLNALTGQIPLNIGIGSGGLVLLLGKLLFNLIKITSYRKEYYRTGIERNIEEKRLRMIEHQHRTSEIRKISKSVMCFIESRDNPNEGNEGKDNAK